MRKCSEMQPPLLLNMKEERGQNLPKMTNESQHPERKHVPFFRSRVLYPACSTHIEMAPAFFGNLLEGVDTVYARHGRHGSDRRIPQRRGRDR